MSIDLNEPVVVPATEAITYDRIGLVNISISVDRATGRQRVSITPALANEDVWSPDNLPELVSDDIASDVAAELDPGNETQMAAVAALQRIGPDLLAVAKWVIEKRN